MYHVVLHFISCSESYTFMYLHVLVCTVYGTYIPVLVHQESIYLYIPGYTNWQCAAAAPLPTFDDLADTACDVLDLCRNRGLAVGPETKLIEIAMEERNCTRLEKLIARVNAKLQDGSVGASSASQGSAASAAIAPHYEPDTSSVAEPQNRIQTHNAAEHASLATFPAVPAYHVEQRQLQRNKRGPKPRPNILVTTADVSSSRPDSGRDCKHPALRNFAFDHGRVHLRNGTLYDITKQCSSRTQSRSLTAEYKKFMRFCFAHGKNTRRKSFAKAEVKVFDGQNFVICCEESERDPVHNASLKERKRWNS
jgi:hypothetical protein